MKSSQTNTEINFNHSFNHIEQLWFLISISIRVPSHSHTLTTNLIVLNNNITINSKKKGAFRLHCIFAITPSGQYSNQLIICKPGRLFQINFSSTSFTRIIETNNGCISYECIQQWLNDFVSLSYVKNHR